MHYIYNVLVKVFGVQDLEVDENEQYWSWPDSNLAKIKFFLTSLVTRGLRGYPSVQPSIDAERVVVTRLVTGMIYTTPYTTSLKSVKESWQATNWTDTDKPCADPAA